MCPHTQTNRTQSGSGRDLISDEVKRQLKTFAPALCSMLLYRFPWLISLRFVADMGEEKLAAAALATTICNVTGMSISVGLSSAMSTLAGQARGKLMARRDANESADERGQLRENQNIKPSEYEDENSSLLPDLKAENDDYSQHTLLPMVILYRGIFIQLLCVSPIGIWWLSGIRGFLLALGQDAVVSELTAVYLQILAPGLWSYSINWTLTAWLQALELAEIPAYGAAVGLALHIPFNIFFIYWLGLGYLGAAMATITFQLIQPAIIISYVFGTPNGRIRLLHSLGAEVVGRSSLSTCFFAEIRTAVSSFSGISEYVGLAVPGVIVISEWWASEWAIFMSGRLSPEPEISLGAMTIYQSINSLCFMFPLASSVSGATRVGNLLGSNDAIRAALAAKVSVAGAIIVSGTLACILYFSPHALFPSLFAPGDRIVETTSRTIPLLSIYVLADGIQVALNGVMKGCGRQCAAMPIVVLAYWVVGVPLAYYLAFVKNGGEMCDDQFCGDVGLVAGMTTGTFLHMAGLGLLIVTTTDWKYEACKAKERLAKST